MCSTEWSSTCTASRRTPRSSATPFGTAQDAATPSSSQPSIGDFLAVWEPLLRDGKEIVSVHLASGVSGTYDSALQAKARLVQEGRDEARLCVGDSQTGCCGRG